MAIRIKSVVYLVLVVVLVLQIHTFLHSGSVVKTPDRNSHSTSEPDTYSTSESEIYSTSERETYTTSEPHTYSTPQSENYSKHEIETPLHSTQKLDEIAPCGAICSYEGDVVSNKNQFYQQLHKDTNCENIMRRMAFRNNTVILPPPEYPPKNMLKEFTMSGNMPITNILYLENLGWNQNIQVFNTEFIEDTMQMVKDGKEVNKYKAGKCVENTLKQNEDKIHGKHGVVIGTVIPWLESILLEYGARRVTTLEYRNIVLDHPKLDAKTPYTYAEQYLSGQREMFDFGATFSSLEHSGLGRYGDPLNPYGDLEAMAQVWCMIKPGGFFAIGLPYCKDCDHILWNAHRVYGYERLQHLTANWHVEDMVNCTDHYEHVFIVLTKPNN